MIIGIFETLHNYIYQAPGTQIKTVVVMIIGAVVVVVDIMRKENILTL